MNINDVDNQEDYLEILSIHKGEEEYLKNYEAVKKLDREINSYIVKFAASYAGIALLSVNPFLIVSITVLGYVTSQAIYRMIIVRDTAQALLEYFGNDGVKITPFVKTDEGFIDLIVRMPDKRMFALVVRSNGKNSIRWREDKRELYVYRKRGAAKPWSSVTKTLESFNERVVWLQKNSLPLVGASSADRRKPIVKAIVIAGETRLAQMYMEDPTLMVEFGQGKAVKITNSYTVYLVEFASLINFLLPKN